MPATNDYLSFFQNGLSGFTSNNAFPFDMKSLMETNRKNLQAVSEAQQLAMTNWQSLAKKQTEMLSHMVENNAFIAREIMEVGTPEEKMVKQAEAVKKVYETSLANLKELTDMVVRSNNDTSDIFTKRINASLSEVKTALKNTRTRKAA